MNWKLFGDAVVIALIVCTALVLVWGAGIIYGWW